jgi:hypothetical protein
MLQVLATSDYLRGGNLAAFRRRAIEAPRPPGAEILVWDKAGRVLAATGQPLNPAVTDRFPAEVDHLATTTGRPQVSDLLFGGAPAFAVVAPVGGSDTSVRYLLSLVVPSAVLNDLVQGEDVPTGMTATLADRRGIITTRSAEPDHYVGMRLPPSTLEAMSGHDEGWLRTVADDGTPVVSAFARSAVAGWTTSVSLPEAAVTAPLRHSIWLATGFGGFLACLALALAYGFSRRIARPIEALAGMARAEGQ